MKLFDQRDGLLLAVAASWLGGCALDTPRAAAPPPLPAAFEQQASGIAARWPTAALLQEFGSEELDSLIALGDKSSLDLAAAIARVRQADARSRQAGAALLPQVDANGTATLFTGGSGGTTAHETDWSAVLAASYEVDFWGKNRAAQTSARALAAVSRADAAVVRATVINGIAATYFQILSLRERVALAQLSRDQARQLLAFVEARLKAGRMTPAELASQQAAVANAELLIPQLRQQELEAVNALAVLVGRTPEGFKVAAQDLQSLREPAIVAGLPSELLQRRPDVQAAERGLTAANADLTAARAALFPSLNLTLTGGVQNPAVQAAVITLTGTGYSLNVGAAIVQTIFDAGRRRSVIAETQARRDELLANYRGAIVAALADVENALGQMQHLNEQRPAQNESITQSERAFDGARLRYEQGSGHFLALLDAQRVLYAAREQASLYKLNRLQSILSLSKALGGGWQGVAVGSRKGP